MKTKLISFVRYFFVLLFVYAATSKLLAFDTFSVQLTQSPIVSTYGHRIAYLILLIEFTVALLLVNKRTRRIGLYLSYGLMVAFTFYIYLSINYSDFIPCSCGGILEKMDWNTHLWFNIGVSILALIALYLVEANPLRFSIYSVVLTIASGTLLVGLFYSSEYSVKKENPFIRRFFPHAIFEGQTLDLKVNSYYFAGSEKENVYLGNYAAPLHFIAVDSAKQTHAFTIQLDSVKRKYTQLSFKIRYPYFFLGDGSLALVFKGRLDTRDSIKLTQIWSEKTAFFSDFIPLDSNRMAFKAILQKDYQPVLGLWSKNKKPELQLATTLLEPKANGLFDSDGIMRFSAEYQSLIYIYYYRNQFFQTDKNLALIQRQQTIDTTRLVDITTKRLASGEHKMTKPVLPLNAKASIHRNLLFIISNSIGKNESLILWKSKQIIDVYDWKEDTYVGSFYVDHLGEDKLTDFWVTDSYFYGLFEQKLVRYKMAKSLTSKFL
ncbi:MauE/DoxX family redox-associated membrane protein [Myroides odoratus]|uniref:MauE/DoxX family redox-associated membrane protein n=1 Tax=Myroides odoratus TaxID=256 RepID=UPI0039B0086C